MAALLAAPALRSEAAVGLCRPLAGLNGGGGCCCVGCCVGCSCRLLGRASGSPPALQDAAAASPSSPPAPATPAAAPDTGPTPCKMKRRTTCTAGEASWQAGPSVAPVATCPPGRAGGQAQAASCPLGRPRAAAAAGARSPAAWRRCLLPRPARGRVPRRPPPRRPGVRCWTAPSRSSGAPGRASTRCETAGGRRRRRRRGAEGGVQVPGAPRLDATASTGKRAVAVEQAVVVPSQ